MFDEESVPPRFSVVIPLHTEQDTVLIGELVSRTCFESQGNPIYAIERVITGKSSSAGTPGRAASNPRTSSGLELSGRHVA